MKRIALALFLGMFSVAWAAESVSEGVPHLSGGVGDEEMLAMRERAADFNLRLLFADKTTGHYLAAVKVRIDDAQGRQILEAKADGPLFYAKLAAGRYRLTVTANGEQQMRPITIRPGLPAEAVFYWIGRDSSM